MARKSTPAGVKELKAADVGLPVLKAGRGKVADGVFELSSHRRAKAALDFALDIADPGFNVFVLGEDRSGRMTQTLAYLEATMADRAAPDDWVYLNNFREPNRPRPYGLPPGQGCRLRTALERLVPLMRDALGQALDSDAHKAQVKAAAREKRRNKLKKKVKKAKLRETKK